MTTLEKLLRQTPRTVAGIMSGTSLDGVDVVVARLAGSGRALSYEVLSTHEAPYPEALRDLLLRNSTPATSDVRSLSNLNVRLAHVYAAAIRETLGKIGLTAGDLDLVGSHGQTVHHVPVPEDCAGEKIVSTLQIGDPSTLAKLLGVPVVGDFRVGDMALGGQGAPLVPYFDFIAFADAHETRGLLNLGGIANLTVLPAGAAAEDVFAFDTGPANMVIDRLVQRYFGQPYDADGAIAASGQVRQSWLEALLDDDYLRQPPPKSTGREKYDEPFVDYVVALAGGSADAGRDLVATLTAFTVQSVHDAYTRFVAPRHPLDVLIPSGGGRRNATLMHGIAEAFAPVPVRPIDAYGVNSDAKEALCFAILAHEAINGVPTNLPRVTGASGATILGKICL